MLEEFKKFAMRGNVVDLAVGVIIGVAFGAIVNSLVGDILCQLSARSQAVSTSPTTSFRYRRRLQRQHSPMRRSRAQFSHGEIF